jgi:hypothetical protein
VRQSRSTAAPTDELAAHGVGVSAGSRADGETDGWPGGGVSEGSTVPVLSPAVGVGDAAAVRVGVDVGDGARDDIEAEGEGLAAFVGAAVGGEGVSDCVAAGEGMTVTTVGAIFGVGRTSR